MLIVFRKDSKVEQVQQRYTKMEYLLCEEGLRELDLFSLGRRRLWGTY